MPQGFERATGVAENTRQCLAKGCHKFFRVANEHEVRCPHCDSENTRQINESAGFGTEGGTRPSITVK